MEIPMDGGLHRRRLFGLGAAAAGSCLVASGLGRPARATAAPRVERLPDTLAKGLLIWDATVGGYVAEEYLLYGTGDVLKPVASADALDTATRDYLKDMTVRSFRRELVSPAQPYVGRLVVYRPANRRRESGNVIVETTHPQRGGSPLTWGEISPFYMGAGDIYVSLQHPVALAALKSADPGRYGAVQMADPTQLWAMLADTGRLIRAGGAASPLGDAKVRRVYMTGYSYTGVACAVFADYHHDSVRLPGGTPVYDGYVTMGNSMYNRPLDVPVIRLNTQSDFGNWGGLGNRRPDSDAPDSRYRHYELAGSAHSTTPWPEPGAARPPARNLPVAEGQPVYHADACHAAFPAGSVVNDYPRRIPMAAIFRNLYAWVDHGQPPPRVSRIEVDEAGKTRTDEWGNALGGVRLPQVATPVASYGVGSGRDCQLFGYTLNFDAERRRKLYGAHAAYVAKVEAVTRSLVDQRLILSAGAADLNAWARDKVSI